MKTNRIYLLLFISTLFLSSCFDDDVINEDIDKTQTTVGFIQTGKSISYFADLGTVTESFNVDLVGGGEGLLPTSPISIPFEIDASSTAVEGVEYNLFNPDNRFVIEAGSDFVNTPFEVNTGNFNPTTATTLVINLLPTGDFVVPDRYKTLTIKFIGCLADVTGTYTSVTTRDDGASVNRNETIVQTDVNIFHATQTGLWGQGVLGGNEWFYFEVICGEVFVPSQGLADGQYSNEVRGFDVGDGTNGYVDSNTGEVHVSYQIGFSGNTDYTTYEVVYTPTP